MPAHVKASLLGPSLTLPVARRAARARHLAGDLPVRAPRPRRRARRWSPPSRQSADADGGPRSDACRSALSGQPSSGPPDRVALLGERVAPSRASSEREDRAGDLALALPTNSLGVQSRCCCERSRLRRVERERAVRRDRARPARARRRAPPPGSARRLTSPSSCARSASIGSPVSASSIARWYGHPLRQAQQRAAGGDERALDLGDAELRARARRRSGRTRARPRSPPATAKPSTAAISGLRGGALDDAREAAVADPRALARRRTPSGPCRRRSRRPRR